MRVLVCGSRHWTDAALIKRRLAVFPAESSALIHGAAEGADLLAEAAARELGWPTILAFPADWKGKGFAAGPIRNRQMLAEGRPDVVLAFHERADLGRGTRDMVNLAHDHGLPVEIQLRGPKPAGRTTVVNLRREQFDVYIGRAGKGQDGYFGNPYTVQEHGERALKLFHDYFMDRVTDDAEFRARVLALRGKRLGCFCKPGPCHGDVIAGWLDSEESR